MTRLAPLLAALLVPAAAHASPQVLVGGAAVPQGRWEQQDSNPSVANPQHSGFALNHARLWAVALLGGNRVKWDARVELEMVPGFQLLDAYLGATAELPYGGFLRVIAGQHFAPFSRQTILPLYTLQMVDYAQLVTLAPGRQLGISATLALPKAPWLQLSGGAYNGKGINQVANLDENLMYVGRLVFRPMAPRAPLMESAHGPDAIWLAVDVEWDKQRLGDYSQHQLRVGTDGFFSFRGFSVYAEYLWGNTTYTMGAPKKDFHFQGFNAQAGYLLPIPGWWYRRFEVAFRFEAIAPNQIAPITAPGDPTQARYSIVPGISYYHRGHKLKVQANYYINRQLDTTDANGNPATYHDDAFIAQLVYVLE
jgi:hypothetical protein